MKPELNLLLDQEIAISNPRTTEELVEHYKRIRERTEALAKPLATEDYMIQAMTNASPTKWHLAHVSWFFEAFILKDFEDKYKPVNDLYNYLFNSYYQDVGIPFAREHRGDISRPTVKEVYDFRNYINDYMISLLDSEPTNDSIKILTILGGNHEQQHQELIMTDIKYNLGINPMFPKYTDIDSASPRSPDIPEMEFVKFDGGLTEIGHNGDDFAFDNEMPVRKVYLNSYKIANRLVTNGEYLNFIESDAYSNHKYWLSEGWDKIRYEKWRTPLYWHNINGEWYSYTLGGLKKLNLSEPVTHVSYYEADAFAKWSGKRLPTEEEWENTVKVLDLQPETGNFIESNHLQPTATSFEEIEEHKIVQLYGDVWEWSASAYLPYPGFSVLAEGISEYNGKFMSSQFVLRGGSCVTPIDHIRRTYRNFWHPDTRFQFSGIRLAK